MSLHVDMANSDASSATVKVHLPCTQDDFNSPDPSSTQEACHMNSVKCLMLSMSSHLTR